MVYHVGTYKRNKTLVIQAVKNIDYLNCEIYDYFGERVTTKKQLKENRYNFLAYLQQQKPEVYGNLKYAVVE